MQLTNELKMAKRFIRKNPEILIGDRAYDSDPLDERLLMKQIQMVAPHKANRKKPATQDGRTLRRYTRRWKIVRLNAWLQNFRKVVVRYEYHASNYFGFVLLACLIILLRHYFKIGYNIDSNCYDNKRYKNQS